MTPQRIPFPVVDEISRHTVVDGEPENVHMELHLPGRLDPTRLRKAVREALLRHPRVLVRQAPGRWWHRSYEWELTDEPDVDPVSWPGGTLAEARERAVTGIPPLTVSPPIRFEVVEPPAADGGGSVIVVCLNHTALDGPACLRVLATAAELYSGVDNSPAVAPPRAERPAGEPVPPARSTWARPARIAADRRESGRRPAPGNGVLVTELPLPARPRGVPYTVNDQLLVATFLTVVRWNREHGQRAHPVRITMPVDDRPRTADMPMGNGTRLVEVTFGDEERTPDDIPALLRATAARTRDLKTRSRSQLGLGAGLLTTPVVPVGIRAAATRALRVAAAPWASTTLLSNLGRISYPLDFGDAGRPTAVWVSAPARMPRGLALTTVSTGGKLQLVVRWSRELLDDAAGNRFGEVFAESLAATAHRDPEVAP
ncbi:condensation protein [Streptomyces durbertensis]|uniref:Condensation protein n=1 Tax=Streptomyces durbertensis TaxID=2448886 RepID=A0ABR6EEW2_9ACTN|nr:condensation protein [Streptomyces durbertensis]MBB1243862.1 condensation protein [Streptomyces durbertensis]